MNRFSLYFSNHNLSFCKGNECLVCESNNLEKLFLFYSRYLPFLFKKIAICRECGHIQLKKMYKNEEYEKINDKYFKSMYLQEGKQNKSNSDKKTRKLKQGISCYLKENSIVLDVGAGEAWALNYFRSRKCHYYAIEPVKRLSDSIQKRGGKLIGNSIYADLSKYTHKFDLIIFRHTLEHLLSPKEALLILKDLLNENGYIYLALPNAAAPSIKKGFITSYIRPIHVSYFCEGNVIRLANSIGLKPIYMNTSGEISILLTHGTNNELCYKNYYYSQKEAFKKTRNIALKKDMIYIVKDIARLIYFH